MQYSILYFGQSEEIPRWVTKGCCPKQPWSLTQEMLLLLLSKVTWITPNVALWQVSFGTQQSWLDSLGPHLISWAVSETSFERCVFDIITRFSTGRSRLDRTNCTREVRRNQENLCGHISFSEGPWLIVSVREAVDYFLYEELEEKQWGAVSKVGGV